MATSTRCYELYKNVGLSKDFGNILLGIPEKIGSIDFNDHPVPKSFLIICDFGLSTRILPFLYYNLVLYLEAIAKKIGSSRLFLSHTIWCFTLDFIMRRFSF